MTRQAEIPATRQPPAYVTVALLLAALLGAATLTYKWVRDRERAVAAMPAKKEKKDYQRQKNRGSLVVKGSFIYARWGLVDAVVPVKPKKKLRAELYHRGIDKLLTPRQTDLLVTARKLDRRVDLAALGISPQQRLTIRQLHADTRLIISDADRAQLEKLCKSWRVTRSDKEKDKAQRAVILAIREIAARSEAATQQSLTRSAQMIQETLTAEQLARIKALDRPSKSAKSAATQPATQPVKKRKAKPATNPAPRPA